MSDSTLILGPGTPAGPAEAPAPRLVETPVVVAVGITSDAGSVTLTEYPYDMLINPLGLTGAGFEPDVEDAPSFAGLVMRSDDALYARLELALPLVIQAGSAPGVVAAATELRRVLRRGSNARLWATLSDERVLSLPVVRRQDPSDSWHPDSWVSDWLHVVLRLLALEPHWSEAPRTITWALASGSNATLPRLLPFTLASSVVLGEANPVVVGGDVDPYPTWTFDGPLTSIVATRGDGMSFTVDEPLLLGQRLTIRTDPREPFRVVHSVAGDWWEHVVPGSQLFPLRAGTDQVQVAALGATSASLVTLQWSPRSESLL